MASSRACASADEVAVIAATLHRGDETPHSQAAAALALTHCPHPAAAEALAGSAKWAQATLAGELSWDNLAHLA